MNFITKTLQITILVLVFTCVYSFTSLIYGENNHQKVKITNQRVQEIYKKIIAGTGQTQDALPLNIVESPIINAYNDGHQIVIYRGLLNFAQNEDEVAMILGHEVAHGMLRHVYFPEFQLTQLEISEAEANADKLGAVYMMKSGYNICVAREIWHRMLKGGGNYQGADHPDYSYRYDELNIGCTN